MPPFTRTVRFRLTVWYSSLLLVFGIAFVVSLNIAVRLDQPDYVAVKDLRYIPVREVAGGAIDVDRFALVELASAEESVYDQNLDNLRNWSIIAVIGLAVASGVGGYVLSGMMLRPVRDMTRVASEIGAGNLGQRINHQGPDDELKALADTFDGMIDRIEHSFEQQRQFVQDASHELRTPLAAIRANIEVAEMDGEVSPDEYLSLFATVKTQTERLTRLTDDLLLLTISNDRGQLELEPVSLHDLAREVVSQLSPVAGTREVTLKIEGSAEVEAEADPDQIYRCVFNLVENAIKYSGPGSTVRLSASRQGDRAELTVSDNGAGIPADVLPHVFDRFFRVDKGRSRREGGTGLGLAIVKELVTGMGGTVVVESKENAGTAFRISLKASTAPEAPTRSASAKTAAQTA